MKKCKLIGLSVIIILLISLLITIKLKTNKEVIELLNTPYIALNNDNLDVNFLKIEGKGKNILYSPLSIKYALNMLKDGAKGNTYDEIEEVLGTNKINKYNNIKGKINIANAAFIRSSFKNKIKQSYIKDLISKYNAEIKYDEFKNANNINKWVYNKTNKLIKEVIDDGYIQDESLKLVLVNALAINMEWITPFDKNSRAGTFYKSNEEPLKAKMMHLKTNSLDHEYYIDDAVTILKKELKSDRNTKLEVVFIEPQDDINKFINAIDKEKLNELLSKTKTIDKGDASLNITLPKFTYEYETSLKSDLQKLGIKEVFGKNANLSKISDDNLYVDDIKHKAKIEISEVGVKAAATTLVKTFNAGMPYIEKDIKLIFNKPFIYLIKSADNEDIWFIGVVFEPMV